jgi:hypothetical protein
MLLNDPLWHQWLLWAAARGAIVGEAQRGAWQPRYLVDDRDGMWTVKVSITEEPAKAQEFTRQITPEQVKAEVVDCWEDLGSPVASPSSHAVNADDIPPVNLEDRENEEEKDPFLTSPPLTVDHRVTMPPPPKAPAANETLDRRCVGAGAGHGPRSAAQQMAMVKSGLLDEIDVK